MNPKNFIAIDFETATYQPSSICEIGLCVVREGEVAETRSWLVRPLNNYYYRRNISIHGIRPEDTEHSPDFKQVWEEIERLYLDEFDNFVAHNAGFDRNCLHSACEAHHLHLPPLTWHCSLIKARKVFNYSCNKLGYLCDELGITTGTFHRAGDDAEMCARLFLRELEEEEAQAAN